MVVCVEDGDIAGLRSAIARGASETTEVLLASCGTYEFGEEESLVEGGSALVVPKGSKIVIDGQGATLSRTASQRCFRLLQVEAESEVLLKDLKIIGGTVFRSFGGGILNEGHLRMRRCHFMACKAVGQAGGSSGLCHATGQLHAGAGGQAGFGGAVFSSGDLLAAQCSFESCMAVGGTGGDAPLDKERAFPDIDRARYGPARDGQGGGPRGGSLGSYQDGPEGQLVGSQVGYRNGGFSCGGAGNYHLLFDLPASQELGWKGGGPGFGGGRGATQELLGTSPPPLRCCRLGNTQISIAEGGGAMGGAIFACAGSVHIQGSKFVKNQVLAGRRRKGTGEKYGSHPFADRIFLGN